MAGVLNRTARQFNIKAMDKKGRRVVVRLVPGFNEVEDEHWNVCKEDDYVKSLKKDDKINFGADLDKQVKAEKAAKAKSKADPVKTGKTGDGANGGGSSNEDDL